jgi:hypothetical protein
MLRLAFWKRRAMREDRIIAAATILAAHMKDDETQQIDVLVARGFSLGEANRLIAFLPMAFSRPVVEELGARVTAIVSVPTPGGGWIEAELMRQPEYAGALALARRHRREGRMDHAIYKLIAGSAAEIDALSNALNEGREIKGAVVASALVGDACAEHLIL